MKFKLDENLPAELVADFVVAGLDAETVIDEGLTGAPDELITSASRNEQRVLLTMDKGIADLRKYPPQDYSGIVLFRPTSQGRGAKLAFVRRHLPALLAGDLNGHLIVVTDAGIRIR
jgi:Domain of unknown function (DUF5615)